MRVDTRPDAHLGRLPLPGLPNELEGVEPATLVDNVTFATAEPTLKLWGIGQSPDSGVAIRSQVWMSDTCVSISPHRGPTGTSVQPPNTVAKEGLSEDLLAADPFGGRNACPDECYSLVETAKARHRHLQRELSEMKGVCPGPIRPNDQRWSTLECNCCRRIQIH